MLEKTRSALTGGALKLALITLVAGVMAFAGLNAVIGDGPRDCDNNAIMYCGAYTVDEFADKYQNGDSVNSSSDLQRIYDHFDIDLTELQSNDVKTGTVTKSGDVVVDGTVVATDAHSSGRQTLGSQASIEVIDGVYMRPTSVSFVSDSLQAFVYMPNGVFEWAVLMSCGNPIQAIEDQPFGQIFKQVTNVDVDPDMKYAADIESTALEVSPGDTLEYRVWVDNLGEGTLTNNVITDSLPAGVTLKSNPSLRDISTDALSTIEGNTSTERTPILITVTVDADAEGTIANQACFNADDNQNGCDNAWIRVVVDDGGEDGEPKLEVEKVADKDIAKVGENITYTITVRNTGDATATNIEVTDTIPEGTKLVSIPEGWTTNRDDDPQATVIGNIDELGAGEEVSFEIVVEVTEYQEGEIVNTVCVDSPDDNDEQVCDEDEGTNVADQQCVALAINEVDGLMYRFGGEAVVINDDATIETMIFNYGDGSSDEVEATKAQTATIDGDTYVVYEAEAQHTYTSEDDYQITMVPVTNEGEQLTGNNDCIQQITAEQQSQAVACVALSRELVSEGTYRFTASVSGSEDVDYIFTVDGDRRDQQGSNQITLDLGPGRHTVSAQIVTSEGMQEQAEACESTFFVSGGETPTTPTGELPKTGPAETAAAILGTGVIGYAGYMLSVTRKRLNGIQLG